mmetsp:Transcript_108226/g.301763  ORF Transcript_108226/g.301763 Transcript_108226/m.301763 type:complete len:227 (-) Transcript_108226:508-1188(-)
MEAILGAAWPTPMAAPNSAAEITPSWFRSMMSNRSGPWPWTVTPRSWPWTAMPFSRPWTRGCTSISEAESEATESSTDSGRLAFLAFFALLFFFSPSQQPRRYKSRGTQHRRQSSKRSQTHTGMPVSSDTAPPMSDVWLVLLLMLASVAFEPSSGSTVVDCAKALSVSPAVVAIMKGGRVLAASTSGVEVVPAKRPERAAETHWWYWAKALKPVAPVHSAGSDSHA